MVTLSSIAFALRTASNTTPLPLSLSHAQQLTAAALGYQSLAAYQASAEEAEDLSEAMHFVLDMPRVLLRVQQLKLPHTLTEMSQLLQATFNDRLPAVHIHENERNLDDHVRQCMQDVVLNHSDTCSASASTNSNGIREIYLPCSDVSLDDLPPLGEIWDEEFRGHVAMEPDVERPYSGHMIYVAARLTLERKGRTCIAEPLYEVISSKLDYNWGGDEDDSHHAGEYATVTLAQALANELGLTLSEAEELVDANSMTNESEDGLVYGYVFDFTRDASPDVARKLLDKYGSLQVRVGPNFYDQVEVDRLEWL